MRNNNILGGGFSECGYAICFEFLRISIAIIQACNYNWKCTPKVRILPIILELNCCDNIINNTQPLNGLISLTTRIN